ncbi:MAG: YndJ family transporter [Planctomycetota bacterium]|nr:YndJ family transporter [Planctomycetota bacterium]
MAALAGILTWLFVLFRTRQAEIPFGLIDALLLLAPTAIVPLGLRLAARSGGEGWGRKLLHAAIRLQPVATLLVAASYGFPPGVTAGACSIGWVLLTALVGLAGCFRLRALDRDRAGQSAGLMLLPVGGAGLFASRYGLSPSGYEEPLILLAAVHFHYAGFAAPLIADALGEAIGRSSVWARRLWVAATIGIVAGTPLVAAGFVLRLPVLKLVATTVLMASLGTLSMLTLIRGARARPLISQALLAVSSGTVVAGMILAGIYGVGEYMDVATIEIPTMAVTHGLLNGLGFSLCGLLGWLLPARNRGGLK